MPMREAGERVRRSVSVIPFLPPSVNSLYSIIYSQRRVEKKPEVRAFCWKAKEYIRAFPLPDDSLVRMDLQFSYSFHHANGRFRKFDSQNMIKILSDVVADKSGWDDSRIKHGSWTSIDSDTDSVVITLTEIHGDDSLLLRLSDVKAKMRELAGDDLELQLVYSNLLVHLEQSK